MDVNTSLTNIGADTKMRVRGRGCADECEQGVMSVDIDWEMFVWVFTHTYRYSPHYHYDKDVEVSV